MAETKKRTSSTELLAGATLGGVAAFVVLVAIAMTLYPGGTWCDRHAAGHEFWGNFLCDLLHAHALGGAENPAAPFARAAMFALVLGLWSLFLALPAQFPERRALARWLRGVGTLSMIGMVLVPLLPSDRFPALHGIAVFVAGAPGFTAAALAIDGQFSARRLRLASLGAAMLAVSTFDMLMYARQYFARSDCSVALPIIQRFAVALVMAWMASSAFALLAGARATSRSGPSAR